MSGTPNQKPLELILARNLLTSISTPAFLIDDEQAVVFFNEAAAALLGRTFEDVGRMTAEEWTREFGPFDDSDQPVVVDKLDVTAAIRDGRPAHATFRIRTTTGPRMVEASAFPIVVGDDHSSGAMILFWPLSENGK